MDISGPWAPANSFLSKIQVDAFQYCGHDNPFQPGCCQLSQTGSGQALIGPGLFALVFGSWLAVYLWALLVFRITAGNWLLVSPIFGIQCSVGKEGGCRSAFFAADPAKLKAQLRQQVVDQRAELRVPV